MTLLWLGIPAGIAAGLGIGLVGGIMQIVDGVNAAPWAGWDIAVGVLRIVLSSAIGIGTFAVFAVAGALVAR